MQGKGRRFRGSVRLISLLAVVGLSLGCPGAGEDEGETGSSLRWVDLVEAEGWTPSAASDDPLAAHRPDAVSCDENFGWRVESSSLGKVVDVDMFQCNYLSLLQPSAVEVPAGAPLQVDLYHFDLTSTDPAESHLALTLDGEIVWEKTIELPGGEGFAPGTSYVETVELPSALSQGVAAGRPVNLHVHNHGQNTYVFVGLRVGLDA